LVVAALGCTVVMIALVAVPGFWPWLTRRQEIYGRSGDSYPNIAALVIVAMFAVPVAGYCWLSWKARRRG